MVVCAGCILILPNQKLVFQRRTVDAKYGAHKLDLFGGHAEHGEHAIETVRRELAEETSLDPEHLDVKYLFRVSKTPSGAIIYVYAAHIKSADFNVFEGEKHESFELDEALKRSDVEGDTRLILEKYKVQQS